MQSNYMYIHDLERKNNLPPTKGITFATMPPNERIKKSSSAAKLCLTAPKRVVDSVASVALTMKRRLSFDVNCSSSSSSSSKQKILHETNASQPGGNAEWGTVSCSALPVGSYLFSSALTKHCHGLKEKQASSTSVVATGALSSPEQTSHKTTAYKQTVVLGAPLSLSFSRQQAATADNPISPTDTVRDVFRSYSSSSSSSSSSPIEEASRTEITHHSNFFTKPTEEQIAAYDARKTNAVRSGDVATLRSLLESGEDLSCCNKFGESLIHMACRRSHIDVVRFLLQEAKVSLAVRDDYGRTPLHDCCWRPSSPYMYELMERLLTEGDPRMLLVKDVRGHAPFDYARKDQWQGWNDFLESRKDLLLSRLAEVTDTSAGPAKP